MLIMKDIIRFVESVRSSEKNAQGKYPVRNFGLIAFFDSVQLKQVPFYQPCIILVLSGRKILHSAQDSVTCETGECIAVSAPYSVSLTNEPAPDSGKYLALVIPFTLEQLQQVKTGLPVSISDSRQRDPGIIRYQQDTALHASIRHYLSTETTSEDLLLEHRLIEILLILGNKDPRLLRYLYAGESWSRRVRVILAEDLAYSWEITEVCRRLATSESTLRRMLQKEKCSFREILKELRLSNALSVLLQTTLPINQVACDSGYESVSRFTENFRKRFGLAPAQFRAKMTESG